jgi:hypothetical protein
MYLSPLLLTPALFWAHLALASELLSRNHVPNCSAVRIVMSLLQQNGNEAIALCQAYLRIQPVTVLSTSNVQQQATITIPVTSTIVQTTVETLTTTVTVQAEPFPANPAAALRVDAPQEPPQDSQQAAPVDEAAGPPQDPAPDPIPPKVQDSISSEDHQGPADRRRQAQDNAATPQLAQSPPTIPRLNNPLLPPWLPFGQASIAHACSCFSIPTPTRTSIVLATSTQNTTLTTTSLLTIQTASTLVITSTETLTPLPPPAPTPVCQKYPEVLTTGARPRFTRSINQIYLGDSLSFNVEECCTACWDREDCLSWIWPGFRNGRERTDCILVVATDKATDVGERDICPGGIAREQQLDFVSTEGLELKDAFMAGPCDVNGLEFDA